MHETNETSPVEWKIWITPLNTLAGLTLMVVATCQDCGTEYPASPRQRVVRCPTCWQQQQRQRRKARHRQFEGQSS